MAPVASGDEPRDEASPPRGGHGAGASVCALYPVVEHGGGVVGVFEGAGCDQAREEVFDVVPVGFCLPQLDSERVERGRAQHGLCHVRGEPGTADEPGPPVFLCFGGDGFVLGSQLHDRAPPLLLHLDSLVC